MRGMLGVFFSASRQVGFGDHMSAPRQRREQQEMTLQPLCTSCHSTKRRPTVAENPRSLPHPVRGMAGLAEKPRSPLWAGRAMERELPLRASRER